MRDNDGDFIKKIITQSNSSCFPIVSWYQIVSSNNALNFEARYKQTTSVSRLSTFSPLNLTYLSISARGDVV